MLTQVFCSQSQQLTGLDADDISPYKVVYKAIR